MQIVKIPNEVLTTPAKPVEKIDKKVLEFIEEMKKVLVSTDNPKGVGLAAPQVGKGLRIFITYPKESGPIHVFINPEIIETSQEKTTGVPERDKKFEGCLSIPNIWGIVHRHNTIKLKWLDEKGYTQIKAFKGFQATIMQHETDHINGILFTKRVLEQKHKLYRVNGKDKEGNDVFDEIEI
jgi:peptide deformylase